MSLSFDLRYAWRLLVKSWGYSLLCAAVVALSVGLAIWSWSLAYSQLLKPVGLPDAADWYTLQIAADAVATPRLNSVDAYTYQELVKQSRSAEHLGAFAYQTSVLSEGEASTILRAAAISPRVLARVKPLLGRTFEEGDASPGAPAVALLSHNTWQAYFAADPGVVGRTARIDASPVQIVGVLPADFFAFEDFELWVPLVQENLARPADSKRRLSPLLTFGPEHRRGPVVNEIKTAIDGVNRDYPDLFNAGRHGVLIPAHRMYTYAATPIVAMLIFMSAAVLVLGSVNISLIFLARLLERSRELALRTAVGASRARLLRQCLLETVVLMIVGLMIGYGLAASGVQWAGAWADYLNRILAIGRLGALMVLRPADLAAAVFAATLIWLLSTLVPAWRITRQDAAMVLAGSGKGVSLRGSGRSAALLVGFQVVVSSMVLLVCASMVMAVNREVAKPTGLTSAQVVIATSPTAFDSRYAEPAQRLRYWEDLTAAVESRIPGAQVVFASAAPTRPLRLAAAIETRQGADNEGTLMLPSSVVSEEYFSLLGIRLRSGRLFDRTDNADSLAVAVIDEEMATRYWPGQDAVGKRLRWTAGGSWITVVGVVSSVGGGRPYRREDVGVVYQPLRQAVPPAFHLLVKVPGPAGESRSALRAAAFAVDRDLPLYNLQTMDDYLAALKFSYKSLVPIIVVIAVITAMITASGLFGLISRAVAQRTQEVGIRRALGATPWRATSMFLKQGAVYLGLAVVGVGVGILVANLMSRNITNILDYAVPSALGVILLMALVVFAASYLPSRRAVALEPGDALRYE